MENVYVHILYKFILKSEASKLNINSNIYILCFPPFHCMYCSVQV